MGFDFTMQPGLVNWKREMPDNEKPIISIITAYYNGKKYIDQTYQCVVNQTFPYFEWIIVDDGSTDQASIDKLKEIAEKDNRIRLFYKENGGPAEARNYGVKMSKTEYICPLDCDDLIEPTYLEYCWWMLTKNSNAAWAFTDSVGFQDVEYLWNPTFDPMLMKKQNLLSVTSLIRKSAFIEINGYDSGTVKHYHEDWYFWLRLIAKGHFPVQSKGEVLFWYRRSENGEFSANEKNLNQTQKKIFQQAADNIICPHKPVIYPHTDVCNWRKPKLSQWNRQLKQQNNKISILFLFPWVEMGGADKFNLDLMRGLDPNLYSIGVITTEQTSNAWLQAAREIVPDIFNLPNFVNLEDYAEFVSYYILSRKVDILFVSNSYHGYYMLPWLRKNFPHLAIVDYVHMEEWYWRNGGYARISQALRAVVEKTYVCNNSTRQVMLDVYHRPEQQVATVHIGVDINRFNRDNIRPGMLYKELELEESRPVVLFICRLHPQKRPFLMLEIAKAVRTKIPNVAFVVVGDGPQKAELERAVEKENLDNTVLFVGARKEVRAYYRDAKVTLITSLKEGLALTAYESCAMGVPVVSADVGGQSDLVGSDVGYLIPCAQNEENEIDKKNYSEDEVNNYTNAIVTILSDPNMWNQLSQNCRKKVKESFTIEHMIQFFDQELRSLVEDASLQKLRQEQAANLKALDPLAEEFLILELQEYNAERWSGWIPEREKDQYIFEGSGAISANNTRLNEAETVLARHEEVVNRHEEVVNRHEEVVNRHEASINHQWEVQKWHEERISALERHTLWGLLRRIYHKLFGKNV